MIYKLIAIVYLTTFSVCYAVVDPVTTAAAASQVSPWVIAGASALGAGITSAFNWFSARKSEDFSERMSSTAHQREVADLRAAGLNPILSAGGKGAPAPSGNMAQSADFGDALTHGLSSAAALAQIDLTGAQAEKTKAEANLLNQSYQDSNSDKMMVLYRLDALRGQYIKQSNERDIPKAQKDLLNQQIDEIEAKISQIKTETQMTAYGLNQAAAESKMWGGPGGYVLPYLNAAKNIIPSIRVNNFNRVKPIKK